MKDTVENRLTKRYGWDLCYKLAMTNLSLMELAIIADGGSTMTEFKHTEVSMGYKISQEEIDRQKNEYAKKRHTQWIICFIRNFLIGVIIFVIAVLTAIGIYINQV